MKYRGVPDVCKKPSLVRVSSSHVGQQSAFVTIPKVGRSKCDFCRLDNDRKFCSLCGFGVSKLMFGGIVICSNASIDLIRLVNPEAPSEWPRFGFTYLNKL